MLGAVAGSRGAQAKDTGQLFVSSEKDNAMAVVDAAKGEVVGSQPLCKRPRHMQLTPDRLQLLVACSDDHRVLVWDIAGAKVAARLDVGEDPEMFDLSPDGRMLYVSNEEDSALTAFDLSTRKKAFEVKVGGEPEGVKVSADGKLVYVTSGSHEPGARGRRRHPQDREEHPGGQAAAPLPAGRRRAVGHERARRQREHHPHGRPHGAGPHRLQAAGHAPEDVTPVGMALSPDGRTAYVGLGRANHVAVVDVASRQVKGYVLVGKRAWGWRCRATASGCTWPTGCRTT